MTFRRNAHQMSTMASSCLLAGAILVGACAGSEADAGGLRVGLVTPGSVADAAWNSQAYAGLERIADSLGAATSHVEARTPAEQEEALRAYAAQGYDLVFAHGFEFQDMSERVSRQYPHTAFVVTSGVRAAENVSPIIFRLADATYLGGMVAGAVTRTGIIGFVGGVEIPPVRDAYEGWVAGARRENAHVEARQTYLNNWDDPAAGREAALALIRVGADVLHHNADQAGIGAFRAVSESPGTWIIGANADQAELARERVLGSAVLDLPHAFLLVGRRVQDGSWRSEVLEFGLASEVVRWVGNPVTDSVTPPDLDARVAAVADSIRAGTVDPLPDRP